MCGSVGRIAFIRWILLLCTLLNFCFSFSVLANEANAVQYEREALFYENLASQTSDGDRKQEYRLLAERKRESASLEREKHFRRPSHPIQDTKEIRQIDRTLPVPENRLGEGIWEIGLGVGNGIWDVSPGGMYIQDPALIGFLKTDFVPRGGIGYDNIFTIDSRESPRKYAVFPAFLKLHYFDPSLRYGFGFQERSFQKNVSYNAWDETFPQRRINAFHYGRLEWLESKFSIFYREDWSYDKTLHLVWGLRVQSANLIEKAGLPLFPATFEYNEFSYSFAPNLGVGYTQNFLGLFLFSFGVEIFYGFGGIEYEKRLVRGEQSFPVFSYVRTEDPIPMNVQGGEFYIRYDFLLNERNRLGISWNFLQFFRQTHQKNFPLVIASDFETLSNEYKRILARTLVYNAESSSLSSQRYQILRWFQLEYVHVF